MTTPQQLLSPAQASEYLGLSVSKLAKMRMMREGPKWASLGRSVRYRVEDLDAWVASQTITTESAA